MKKTVHFRRKIAPNSRRIPPTPFHLYDEKAFAPTPAGCTKPLPGTPPVLKNTSR